MSFFYLTTEKNHPVIVLLLFYRCKTTSSNGNHIAFCMILILFCLLFGFHWYRVIQKKLFLERELLESWDFLHCVQKPKIWSPIAPEKIDFFCQFCSDFFGKKNSNMIWKNFDPIAKSGMY